MESEEITETVKCVHCLDKFPPDETEEVNGSVYCRSCWEDDLTTCSRCATVIEVEHASSHNDELYCESCFSANFIMCRDCGETESRRDAYLTISSRFICELCYSSYYFTCKQCDEVIHLDGYREDGYCSDCHEDQHRGPIHDYSYTPSYSFYDLPSAKKKGSFYLGVELEVAHADLSDSGHERHAEEVVNRGENRVYCKNDSSIDPGGFEIVSHPASLDYHIQHMGWAKILNYLRSHGYVSHNNSSCGLHVHVSKRFLTTTEQVKLALFVYNNRDKFERFARRSEAHYAKFKGVKETLDQRATEIEVLKRKDIEPYQHRGFRKPCAYDAMINNPDRYEAINFLPHQTIEFRLFKGTLKTETFFATLEFVDSVCRFVKETNTVAIASSESWGLYQKWVQGRKYTYLANYFNSRGIK